MDYKEQLVSEFMTSENSVKVMKYYNDRYNQVKDMVEGFDFKESVEISFSVYSHEAQLNICFNNLNEDISAVKLLELHKKFDNLDLPYYVEIVDLSNMSYDYDDYEEPEKYIITNTNEYGTNLKIEKEIEQFFKGYSDLYLKIVPESNIVSKYPIDRITLDVEFKGNKVDRVYYDYGFGGDTLVGDGIEFYDKNLATGTYEHYLFSKYFSKYIGVINNLWFLTDKLDTTSELDINKVKELIAKDILKAKKYIEEIFKPIKKSSSFYGLKYELEFYKGLNLNVIVSGYNLDMNFLNGRSYCKDINRLGLKYINVNVIINNHSLLKNLVGSERSGITRIDSIYKVEGNVVISKYLSDIYKGLKDTYGINEFNPSYGNGRILVDISDVELGGVDTDLDFIPLTWANEFGLYERKGSIGDIKFLVHVDRGNRADNINKESVEFNAVLESFMEILKSLKDYSN